jgi:4-hydroxy-3-methylbut-2-enyl diphosphate reductase
MQKIIVAKNAGFCMGVRRAVDMVLELASKSKEPICTYGPLIHNPQVINDLASRGVKVLDKESIPKCGTVVIRTHGVTPNTKERFEKAGLNVFDATCPFVKKVQSIIDEYSKKGYTIVIVGDKGHAEVDSYLGYAKGKGIVVSTFEEVSKVSKYKNICVVAQTTQDKKVFKKIVNKLKNINSQTKVFDTICNATSNRQQEALNMSRKVGCMIVVGGSNSANTLRLVDICKSAGVPTFFIEKVSDLKINQLSRFVTIGITAGASTPKDAIQEVVNYIKKSGVNTKSKEVLLATDGIPKGTVFQEKVWRAIKTIPYGKTMTYKGIAKLIGHPKSYRAVGSACKKNPLPGPIPCHRVVRSDGSVGGYSKGIRLKKAILKKESSGK